MTIDMTGLVRPYMVEMTKREDNPNIAEFRLQPLERGFGYTLGNSLRRLLLSSLRGSAVWAFRMDGVVHEHQTVAGVLEDVHQIIQRLKALTLVLDEDTLTPEIPGTLDSFERGIGIVGIPPKDEKSIDLDSNGVVDTFSEFVTFGGLVFEVWGGQMWFDEPIWTGSWHYDHGPDGPDEPEE